MPDDRDIIYLPYVVPAEEGGEEAVVDADPDPQQLTVIDYSDHLQAIADNQMMQLDSFSAALAVIVFALAAVFGAIVSRGLFRW